VVVTDDQMGIERYSGDLPMRDLMKKGKLRVRPLFSAQNTGKAHPVVVFFSLDPKTPTGEVIEIPLDSQVIVDSRLLTAVKSWVGGEVREVGVQLSKGHDFRNKGTFPRTSVAFVYAIVPKAWKP
jgi:hypothetical protein